MEQPRIEDVVEGVVRFLQGIAERRWSVWLTADECDHLLRVLRGAQRALEDGKRNRRWGRRG